MKSLFKIVREGLDVSDRESIAALDKIEEAVEQTIREHDDDLSYCDPGIALLHEVVGRA